MRPIGSRLSQSSRVRAIYGLIPCPSIGGEHHFAIGPRALADKLLHGLDIAIIQSLGHRLNRFALDLEHLASHILQRPETLLLTAERTGISGCVDVNCPSYFQQVQAGVSDALADLAARYALIQRTAYSSCPINRSHARIVVRNSGRVGSVIAAVNPRPIPRAR